MADDDPQIRIAIAYAAENKAMTCTVFPLSTPTFLCARDGTGTTQYRTQGVRKSPKRARTRQSDPEFGAGRSSMSKTTPVAPHRTCGGLFRSRKRSCPWNGVAGGEAPHSPALAGLVSWQLPGG
jgi:hypothetical protein